MVGASRTAGNSFKRSPFREVNAETEEFFQTSKQVFSSSEMVDLVGLFLSLS